MPRSRTTAIAFAILALAVVLSADTSAQEPQRVTLYSRMKYERDGYGRAAFQFKAGIRSDHKDWSDTTKNRYHVLYGNGMVNGESDWIALSAEKDSWDRVKDIGAVEWADLCCAQPLPTPPRETLMRTPKKGETFEASSEQRVAKAVVGHMYVLHVKNKTHDFYVMFRVDELEAGDHCTISWKIMASPE